MAIYHVSGLRGLCRLAGRFAGNWWWTAGCAALVWLLPQAGIESELVMHIALATSLASIVLTSGSSARNHIKLGNVDFTIVKSLAPGVIVGGLGGSAIAELVPTALLPRIFAVIVLLLALQMLISMRISSLRQLPGPMATVCSGGSDRCSVELSWDRRRITDGSVSQLAWC